MESLNRSVSVSARLTPFALDPSCTSLTCRMTSRVKVERSPAPGATSRQSGASMAQGLEC